MADEEKNIKNQETASVKEQAEVKAGGNIDDSQITGENLEAELEEIEKKLEETERKPKPEPKVEKEEAKTEEIPKEPEVEIPEDLIKKSPEELAKMYKNLRDLQSKQAQELGELRKIVEEDDRIKREIEEKRVSQIKDQILKQSLRKMTQEERDNFLNKFAEDPEEAVAPLIQKVINPFLVIQARYNNEMAINRLKKQTKDKLIPYEKYEKEINAVLDRYNTPDGRNILLAQYGSGAFEVAYNEFRNEKLPEILDEREKELISKAKEKAEEEYNKKKKAFTEPQGQASVEKVGEYIDYNSMDEEEAIRRLERIIPESNR